MKKLSIVFLGLLALIIATPVIFSKISNSKIDKTILNLNQNSSVVVKETKSNEGYLDTKRSFEVTITDKSFPQNEYFTLNYAPILKKAVFSVDLSFRNLPVTEVVAVGKLKDLEFKGMSQRDTKEMNEFLKDKIVAHLVTDDFKHFNIKLDDIVFKKEGVDFKLTGMESSIEVADHLFASKSKIDNFSIHNGQEGIDVNSISINSKSEDDKKYNESETNIKKVSFNFNKYDYYTDKTYNNSFVCNEISLKGHSKVNNNLLEVVSSTSFKKASYDNGKMKLEVDGEELKVTLSKLNYSILKEIVTDLKHKKINDAQNLVIKLLNDGFVIAINEKVDNVKFGPMAFGKNSIDAKLEMDKEAIKKAGGIEAVMYAANKGKFDAIKFVLNVNLSKEIYTLLKLKANPDMINSNIQKGYIIETPENGVKTKIEVKNGKIFANDKEYKLH